MSDVEPSTRVNFLRPPEAEKPWVGIAPGPELALAHPVHVGVQMRADDLRASQGLAPAEAEHLAHDIRDALEKGGTRRAVELIVGAANFLPAWFLQVGDQRQRAVCKLEVSGVNYRNEAGRWFGTGFLVAESILLTNHHVLNSAEVARGAECLFDYQMNPAGQIQPVTRFRMNPDLLFLTSPVDGGLDFTFVWVDGRPGSRFGFVPMDRNFFKILDDEFANIIQHPRGDLKSVVLQENTIEAQDEVTVHYISDTEPGSSGSPVFSNDWQVVALHHASYQLPSPGGGASPSRKVEYRNEGIKLSAIAAHLERLHEHPSDAGEALPGVHEAVDLVLPLFKGTDAVMGYFGSLGRRGDPTKPAYENVVVRYRGEADDVDVGFWNIEWFNRQYAAKVEDVARVIVDMNLDIWAMSETSAEATETLVGFLKRRHKLDFAFAPCEPDAPASKQTVTVMWNTRTIKGKRQDWPTKIRSWLTLDSRQRLGGRLEAVEGPIFPRYPALYHFTALHRDRAASFDFYLVPLHLKAMDEGSKRRRLASKILAAAIHEMARLGHAEKDWVIGGDFNAELATSEFAKLAAAGLVPLGAQDESEGAFSYIKRPKSLIDHIFLSPNLAEQYGPDDYFIVAHDKVLPEYVRRVSDHRPVLVRLSLGSQPREEAGAASLPRDLAETLSTLDAALGQHERAAAVES